MRIILYIKRRVANKRETNIYIGESREKLGSSFIYELWV